MTSLLRTLQEDWNSLVPAAQARGISRVRLISSTRLESIASRRQKLDWLRAQLGSSTSIDNLTFGVEIECYLPVGSSHSTIARLISEAGVDCNAEHYNHTARPAWKVVSDGSLSNYTQGCEIVSRVLKGEEGFEEIRKVCQVLVAHGAKVNKSCGFHVHVGIAAESLQTTKNLVRLYQGSESVINSLLSPSRRYNPFASSHQVSQSALDAANDMDSLVRSVGQRPGLANVRTSYRYRKVNLMAYYQHRTVEFRQHQGTVEGQKVENWVRLCLRLVVAARTRSSGCATLDQLMETVQASDAERAYFRGRQARFTTQTRAAA